MEHHPTQQVKVEMLSGTQEGIRILRPHGPLTIHNFFEFQDLSRQRPEPGVLIVDLAEVPYIDSAALGCLVGIHVSCDKAARKYALTNVNERVMKLFEMSGVNQFLKVYDTVADAETRLS